MSTHAKDKHIETTRERRAHYVMEEIATLVGNIDESVERLALFVAEACREAHWKLTYATKAEWIKAVFVGSTTRFYVLAAVGESFKNEPELIKQFGLMKCYRLASFTRKGKLPEKIKHEVRHKSFSQVDEKVRLSQPLEIKSRTGAVRRIAVLKKSLELIEARRARILKEIHSLCADWGIEEAA